MFVLVEHMGRGITTLDSSRCRGSSHLARIDCEADSFSNKRRTLSGRVSCCHKPITDEVLHHTFRRKQACMVFKGTCSRKNWCQLWQSLNKGAQVVASVLIHIRTYDSYSQPNTSIA